MEEQETVTSPGRQRGGIEGVAASSSLAPLLRRAHEVVADLGDKPFAFWYDGKGKEAERYSFRRMWDEAGKIAYMLREEWGVPKGSMVVLCYGPGLHFFAAFLGCLRAGVVAVMVYPPAPPLSKSLPKMSKIVADCKPVLCLTDSTIAAVRRVDRSNPLSDSRKLWPADLDFKATDGGLLLSFFFSSSSGAGRRSFDELSVAKEDLAFLQYTSGSTGDPKGVMVTFGALMANVYLIGCHPATGMYRLWPSHKAGDSPSDQPEASSSGRTQRAAPSERIHNVPTTGFSWLPQYHDMGLVLGLLTPFLTGMTMHYMSPVSFIKRPLLWLELISRHRVEWSVAPDFAYALCARYMAKVRGTRKEPKLDLSHVVRLQSGAEPIRAETVERFEGAFLPFGLRQGWFSAAYGLAEHVVLVSWTTVLDRSPSRPDLTSVGSPSERADFMDIRIVNPDTMAEVGEAGATGEVWVSSPSVAAGYWGKPELLKEVFQAKLSLQGGAGGSDSLPPRQYLRTGDVGFVEEGLLYICGRIKDLIIFNGVNHYPQDIEFAVQEVSDAIRQGCIAAFSSDETGGDGVLEVVFEIRQERESEAQAVVEAAQASLSSCLGLRAARVVAVKQKTIPKTTSGKIRRRATRQALHAGELHMVRELTEDSASGQEGRAAVMSQDPPLNDLTSTCSTPEDRPLSVEGEVPERRGERDSSLAIHSMESLGRQARVAIILEEIIGFAAEVTHNRALSADDRFMEAGMTSVMMAELAVMLEDFLGSERTEEEEGDKDFELGAEAFFDYPTPALLAAHVETTLFGEGEGDDASADGLLPSLLSDGGGDIAVIGLACRFPGGCNSPEELWAKLCNEEDCVTDAPSERGLGKGVRGGFIDTMEAFDNAFFGMSIAEAEAQDPNQRIMLEVAYEALHRAGYEGRRRLEGHRVGVFVGVAGSDWPTLLYENPQLTKGNPYVLAGASRACIAARISHTLGLEGPCESVDTACSSAIVALNNACKSLRLRECSSAIVGGVNLLLHHQGFDGLADARLLSKEGCCKSFDVRADGYVRSEGSGAVVLKLLPEAIKDRDRILAIIKAAAVSHSGVSSSLSAPKGAAQESLAGMALRQAGCEGREVSYVEAHGTGTVIGDSIEMRALKAAFTPNRPEASPLVVGTVKTTLGHMEGASGMAQLIKAILVLQHREAPANLHLKEVNPKLKLEGVPVTLPTRRTPLSSYCSDGSTLLAGVNSYGLGGVNAHVILGSYGGCTMEAQGVGATWQGFPSSRTFSIPRGAARELQDFTPSVKSRAATDMVMKTDKDLHDKVVEVCIQISARLLEDGRRQQHQQQQQQQQQREKGEGRPPGELDLEAPQAVDARTSFLEIAALYQRERQQEQEQEQQQQQQQQQQRMRERRAVCLQEEAELEAQLRAVGAETNISRTTSFLELGMDSLAVVQLVNTLQDQFELQEELPLAEVLQNPTAEGLATLVVEQRHQDLVTGGGKGEHNHRSVPAQETMEEKEPLMCAKMMSSVVFKVTQVVLIAVLLAHVFVCMILPYRYLRWLKTDSGIETSVWVGKDLSHLADPESSYASPGGVVGWGPLVSFSIVLWFLTYSASIVCIKWLLVGTYFEGTVAIHASYYHRWWYVNACINVWQVGGGFLTLGTPGITLFYKLLGADVSWRCSISTFLREFDLITIGAGASVSGSLCPRSFTPSSMVFRSVVVGAGAEVEAGAVVHGGVTVGEGTRVARLAVVYPLTRIPAGDGVWEGNPAQRKQSRRSAEEEEGGRAVKTDTERDFAKGSGGGWAKEALELLQGVVRMVLISASVMLAAFFSWMPAVAYTFLGVSRDFRYAGVMSTVFEVYGALLTLALYLVLLKWVIAPSCLLRPGVYTDNFGRALRRWYLGKLHSQVSGYVLVFARWRLFDWWGKALGVRMGRGAINSGDGAYNPETAHLITFGHDAFASYAAFTTDEPLRRGSASVGSATAGSAVGPTRVRGTCTVGDEALLGYMCVMEPGAAIPAQQGVEMFTAVAAEDTIVSRSWGQGAVVGGGREDAASPAALWGPGALTNGDVQRWAAFVARETWGTLLWLATHAGSLVVVVEVGRLLNQSVGKKRGMSFEAMLPLYGAVCGCAGALALTLLLVASKWLLVGDFSRGADPITGACMSSQNISRSARTQYFRLLTRLRHFFLLYILTPLFSGTWLYNLYVRASCSRPKDISLEALVLAADVHDFDFLTLEAGAILDMGSEVWGHVLRPRAVGAGEDSTAGLLVMSPCRVEAGAVLHPYAFVTHGTVGSRAELFAYSPPLMGQRLRDGGKYGGRGVPGLLKRTLLRDCWSEDSTGFSLLCR